MQCTAEVASAMPVLQNTRDSLKPTSTKVMAPILFPMAPSTLVHLSTIRCTATVVSLTYRVLSGKGGSTMAQAQVYPATPQCLPGECVAFGVTPSPLSPLPICHSACSVSVLHLGLHHPPLSPLPICGYSE